MWPIPPQDGVDRLTAPVVLWDDYGGETLEPLLAPSEGETIEVLPLNGGPVSPLLNHVWIDAAAKFQDLLVVGEQ